MLVRAIYALRYLIWMLANLRRRLRRPPDYVVFILEGAYPELPAERGNFLQRRLSPPKPSLRELARQFRVIAGDPRVRGVVLHLRQLEMPIAHLQRLRGLVDELRAAGKRVVAWSHGYDGARYYLASAADEVLLQSGGYVEPTGYRVSYSFLADALGRIGVKADIVQISPYKSAGDTLARRSMSDEMRQMVNWVMDAVYADFIRGIAEGRNLDEEGAKALVDNAPYTDRQALDARVVDRIIGEEDLPAYLGEGAKPARLSDWDGAYKGMLRPSLERPGRYVALLRIEGPIVEGRSRRPPGGQPLPLPFLFSPRAGDLTVVQEARAVLADKRAAAVVVYVDSVGGSSDASEAMAAALDKVAAKKPLVVAMGAVAGSGGYYVSSPAHWIVAQSGTLTGSIGVLSGKLVTAGLLDKLLLGREAISRGRRARFASAETQFSQEERKLVWDHIKRVYDLFLDRVAASRKMKVEEVDSIGGGRVWTGRQALERGLVDELGGLDDALSKARELAGLHSRARVREVRVGKRHLPPPMPDAAALAQYAIESVRMFNGARALCLCPLVWEEGQSDLF